MSSAFHKQNSFNIDEAAERKPWAVISSLLKPSLRRAALIVFSLMQRSHDRFEGKREGPSTLVRPLIAGDRPVRGIKAALNDLFNGR